MSGRSLLESPESSGGEEEAVFGQYLDIRYMVRTEWWKLIYRLSEERSELFDLRDDPGELGNLAEEREDVLRPLSRRLERWREGLVPLELVRERVDESDETREQLKALGYLD